MTSVSKILTSSAVALSLIASQAVAFSASASASDWRRGESHRARGFEPSTRSYTPPHRSYDYGHRPAHRDRTGDAVAGAILGIGALIVGAAIADAHRNKRYHDED